MRSEEWAKLTRVVPQHRAKRAKGPGARPWSGSRGETHCGYRAKPCRSLRQSLNRRKPTKRCRKVKKHTKVKETIKRCRRKNLCTAFSIQINKVKPAKSVAILRHNKPARIIYHFLSISAQRIPIFNALSST